MKHLSSVLEGIKVTELAGVLAGPSVGMFLAECGAEVIKVEPPGRGDVTRTWKLASEPSGTTLSSYFCSVNWGKSSRIIDLKSDAGREECYRLTDDSDIVLVSYKPGDDKKLGMDYETLKAGNPRLIYGAVTGFGADVDRAAYDAVVQAESGFMHINGTAESGPLKLPVALMDLLAAHLLKEKILLAMLHRERTGQGSKVEVSLIEAALSSLANQGSAWLVAGSNPEPIGSEHPHIYPYGSVFETADGKKVLLAIGNDYEFARLTKTLDKPELADDPRFSTNPQRSLNRNALKEILSDLFNKVADGDKLLATIHENRVPAGALLNISEACEKYRRSEWFSAETKAYGAIRGIPGISFGEFTRKLSPPPELGGKIR